MVAIHTRRGSTRPGAVVRGATGRPLLYSALNDTTGQPWLAPG